MLKWANDVSILIGVNQSHCHRSRVFHCNLSCHTCAKYIPGTFLVAWTLPGVWGVNKRYYKDNFKNILMKYHTYALQKNLSLYYLPGNVESLCPKAQDSLFWLLPNYIPSLFPHHCAQGCSKVDPHWRNDWDIIEQTIHLSSDTEVAQNFLEFCVSI